MQRDKMRELLRDALMLALEDVPDGRPGAEPSCSGLARLMMRLVWPNLSLVHVTLAASTAYFAWTATSGAPSMACVSVTASCIATP